MVDGVPADVVECALKRLLRDAETEAWDLGFVGGSVVAGVLVDGVVWGLKRLLSDVAIEGCGRGCLGGIVLAGALGDAIDGFFSGRSDFLLGSAGFRHGTLNFAKWCEVSAAGLGGGTDWGRAGCATVTGIGATGTVSDTVSVRLRVGVGWTIGVITVATVAGCGMTAGGTTTATGFGS